MFLSRGECTANFVLRNYADSLFTDGSKTESGTGSELLPDDMRSVLSAEIYAMNVAIKKISQFSFYTWTLNKNIVKSKCFYDSIQPLCLIKHQQVELKCVPGLQDTECKDESVVIELSVGKTKLLCLLWLTKLMIEKGYLGQLTKRFQNFRKEF